MRYESAKFWTELQAKEGGQPCGDNLCWNVVNGLPCLKARGHVGSCGR